MTLTCVMQLELFNLTNFLSLTCFLNLDNLFNLTCAMQLELYQLKQPSQLNLFSQLGQLYQPNLRDATGALST